MRIPLLLFILLPQLFSAASLRSEAEDFLSGLAARGYTGTGLTVLELGLLEPCTLAIYPPAASGGGFVVGMGGNNTLDLHLRLEGDGWFREDSLPDDLPVIRVDSAAAAGGLYVIACARDMTGGSRTDSTAVMWAFSTVDPEDE